MKKNLVWLASYPKSGNTWTRIFLANYLLNAQKPLPINKIHSIGVGDSGRNIYEKIAGRKFSLDEHGFILTIRGKVLEAVTRNKADVNMIKTHNICSQAMGVDLIPDKYTLAAVYIVRNPLDMVMSYARHYDLSVEDATTGIGSSENANTGDEKAVPQYLGSWSEHVESWIRPHPYPVCVVRYEDLLEKPEESFRKILELFNVPVDQERLSRAIKFASFDEVKKQEEEKGFIERPKHSEKFFGKGTSGHWREELPQEIVDQIISDHGVVMKRFGYLE